MFRQIWAAVFALALVCLPAPAMAARVAPMIVDLEPIGRGTTARIEMASDSARDIPYEVLMMRGEISEDGRLTLVPADEDFLVFPTQVLLESNSRQVFRIQYVGEAELAESQIYYMSIKQIPIAFEEVERSQVQVVVNYNVLVNVVPDGAEAEPVVRSITAATREVPAAAPVAAAEATPDDADSETAESASPDEAPDEAAAIDSGEPENSTEVEAAEPATTGTIDEVDDATPSATAEPAPPPMETISGLEVRLGNDGNRYFLAGLSIWKIKGKTVDGENYDEEFAADKIARSIGAGVVGPGKERIFFLPMETQLDPETVSIEIEIPDEDE
ncbi:MAG: hypothetical protein AAGK02_04340 [Pseudomonadota bacterium]